MRLMPLPPARPGSVEAVLHEDAPDQALSVFPRRERADVLSDELGHRAVGVVYHPERDAVQYVPTVLGERYDAFLWFDQSRGVLPLRTRPSGVLEPETFPTGV
jgi:erythromycin esterase-like protein